MGDSDTPDGLKAIPHMGYIIQNSVIKNFKAMLAGWESGSAKGARYTPATE
jgi:hypothetical protein